MKILKKSVDGRNTFWKILSEHNNTYVVSVDEEGLWSCSCPGCEFHGSCSHILGIKWQREWRNHILPTLKFLSPTPVSEEVMERFMNSPRYIAHLMYRGERNFMAVCRNVFVGHTPWLDVSGCPKLAGTVLEVFKTPNGMVATDLIYFKGQDFRPAPLQDRLSKMSDVLGTWRSGDIEEAPLEVDSVMKHGVYKWTSGGIILKDLGGTYVQLPRNWIKLK